MRIFLTGIFTACLSAMLAAQTTNDTTIDQTTLTAEEYRELVLQNHPLTQQARLIQDRADAERLKSAGSFDPKIYGSMAEKDFDAKDYYALRDYGLKIPTWFGLTGKAGYERNNGVFLNPENNVPNDGLWFAELSLTLGKGLFIDERRAMLKQARLLQESADFEIRNELNQLMQNALAAYWDWYQAEQQYQIAQNALELAQFRFRGIRSSALIGETAMVDTLEAFIQVQNRRVNLQKRRAERVNARQKAETFLWLEGRIPLEISAQVRPDYDIPQWGQLPENWLNQHPLLQFYRLKLERLDIEQRWNREQLKPQVDLKYKLITEATGGDIVEQYNADDFVWGLEASFPIFLRKERGRIQKTGVKIQSNQLEQDFKRRDLQNKVNALRNERLRTQEQLQETTNLVENYRRLLDAETTKFNNGESSLFLVNRREIKYVESRQKQAELEAKLHTLNAKVQAAAGVLVE